MKPVVFAEKAHCFGADGIIELYKQPAKMVLFKNIISESPKRPYFRAIVGTVYAGRNIATAGFFICFFNFVFVINKLVR